MSKHIIEILENSKFKDLSRNDLEIIELHAETCAKCQRAYQAAKISSIMLESRAKEVFEPSAFFQAKVMNAWKQQNVPVVNRFWQMWQDAKLLVSGLAAAVLLLGVFTFSASMLVNNSELLTANDDYYSAGAVFFNQAESAENLTDADVFEQIYGEAEDNNGQ